MTFTMRSLPAHTPTALSVGLSFCLFFCESYRHHSVDACWFSESLKDAVAWQQKQLSILDPVLPPPPPLSHLLITCVSLFLILLNTVILLLLLLYFLLLSLCFSLSISPSLDSSSLSSLTLLCPSPFVWGTGPQGPKAAVKHVWWIQYAPMKVLDQNFCKIQRTCCYAAQCTTQHMRNSHKNVLLTY